MEALDILEKKINLLLETIKNLKDEAAQLKQENALLSDKIEQLGSNLVDGRHELDSEKEKAKVFVEGLIQSIDSLVEVEPSDG